jgi:NAD(P)-dependent dehydrogenase (short-subunit alcohol dehydrogenase family)
VSADLSEREGAESVVAAAVAELGGVDILVNNVGAGDVDHLSLGGFLDADDEQWRRLLNLNLFSAMWTTRAALPSLIERRGAIVNLSSINSRAPVRSATARPRRL